MSALIEIILARQCAGQLFVTDATGQSSTDITSPIVRALDAMPCHCRDGVGAKEYYSAADIHVISPEVRGSLNQFRSSKISA
jgi:hypothetical protein